MEEDCGGVQGLSWAVEPREREINILNMMNEMLPVHFINAVAQSVYLLSY
jgi:hypothetical protein